MFNKKHSAWLISCLSTLMLSACDNDDNNNSHDTEETTLQAVSLQFVGMVGDAKAECGTIYENIGLTAAPFKINDFRVYISNPALLLEDGSEASITLDQDGAWQYQNVAMLDLRNGSGCTSDPLKTNARITGDATLSASQVPVGVCFDVGIPFELNHSNSATAPSPLNSSGMMWAWLSGHKFIRIDGQANPEGTPQSFHVHLGSTGCTNAASNSSAAPDTACTYPNRPRICLDDFTASSDAIAIDVEALLADSDVTVNGGGALGCMSGNSDPDCQAIMPKLGLEYVYANGVDAAVTYPANTTQTVFKVISE